MRWFALYARSVFTLAGLLWLAPAAAAQTANVTETKKAEPALPTELLNEHLPAWLRFSGEYRVREEGFQHRNFRDGDDDLYLLNRIRFGVQVAPVAWLKFYAQAQDSRVFFNRRAASAPPLQDRVDLRQAYGQLGDVEKGRVALRVGRQELAFGEERLVGAGNWGNVARTFDAARLTLQQGGYRVDAFASSVVVANDHGADQIVRGDDLHGIYGSITSWVPRSKVEPYLFWHVAPLVKGEGGAGKLDSKTYGVRWNGLAPHGLEYNVETAGQHGTWAHDSIQAWAAYGRIGRKFTTLPWTPRVLVETNFASGDKNPHDGKHGTFDVLYPTPHDKYGLADQVGWKNVRHVGATGEWTPRKGLVLQAKFHDWWLASTRDGLYAASGALLARDVTGNSGRHIGEEIDGQVLWTASQRMQVGLGVGHLFAGEFVQKATPGKGYTFPYVMLIHRF